MFPPRSAEARCDAWRTYIILICLIFRVDRTIARKSSRQEAKLNNNHQLKSIHTTQHDAAQRAPGGHGVIARVRGPVPVLCCVRNISKWLNNRELPLLVFTGLSSESDLAGRSLLSELLTEA